ncbi:helix-turn-helix domain-containing protein [Pseudoclavibacter endophyticus]|uniref:Helix-turn-helix domain-containing protein n=1 Tax=Pseudoclavibacter endophyticus TaxID=1778590 RepID=A0A6H9WPY9_9MICO|nr:IclR family transcriptional regulator C-terminal domain-containing protein [Pseudoclavibacter endophyticus]KAB1648065.1 helix-turn-helix domain-containing protein [Pseudoclavibacter endophyticus]
MDSELEESMGGLAKGLAIVESFDRDHPRLTVTEAANLTGLTPPAARRCMRTLESLGYLSYDGKFFRPTPRVARLVTAYTDTDSLPRLAAPLLVELRDEFGESTSLSVLDGNEVLFIGRAEGQHLVKTGQRVGGRLPAAHSAAGRVLMGDLAHDVLTEVIEASAGGTTTEKALRGADALAAEVRDVAVRGYSVTDEEVEIGLRAVAVPVRDPGGLIVASLSISALSARASVERLVDAFVPALALRASKLGRML